MLEPKPSRIAFLRSRVDAAWATDRHETFPVPFRDHPRPLVKIEVPIEFPLYNIRSGRTHRAQSQYIAEQKLSDDFFADPEDPAVQKAQEQLLLQMVALKGLDKDLAEKKQKNPLVLTFDGFVLDGNRRLAALRRDGEAAYAAAVVLPDDATVTEIYETELELQMARETKAEYNWIDKALHVEYGLKQSMSTKSPQDAIRAVARHMNVDVGEIEGIVKRLSLVNLYLEWLGSPGKYHEIPEQAGGTMEQAFRELDTRLSAKPLPNDQRRAIQEACFAAMLSGGGYQDVRQVIAVMRSRPEALLAGLRDQLPADLVAQLATPAPAAPVRQAASEAEDLLVQLAESDNVPDPGPGATVLNLLRDPARRKEVGGYIRAVAEEMEAERKEASKEALPRVNRALRHLRDVSIGAETKQLDIVAQSLAQVADQVQRLTGEVERARADQEPR